MERNRAVEGVRTGTKRVILLACNVDDERATCNGPRKI